MKAIVYTEYGSPEVLRLKDIPKPVPKEDEILVRVRATAVNYGDLLARNFANSPFNMPRLFYLPARLSFGWNKPTITVLGSELSGDVESVGNSVTKFKPGDAVFAYRGAKMGANAEYICLPENGMVAIKPSNLDYAEAAALPYGAIMATSLLKKAKLQRGQKILINGASGGIGAIAVQLAKHYYGAEVTGVCGEERLDYIRALGADRVIDYKKEDFTQNGETYDLIMDILGRTSFARVKKSLKPDGILLYVSYKGRALLESLWTALFSRKKVLCPMADEKIDSLEFIRELTEAGKVRVLVDKRFPLEQTAEAHRYSEGGQKRGKVVITL